MTKYLEILDDKPELIKRALRIVMGRIEEAIALRGVCTIALAGGSTPKPLYEKLAEQSLPWAQLHIFWGDERYVPADHPDSNQRMARLAWLNQVPIPEDNIHPMPTEAADPQQDAAAYDATLRNFFGDRPWPSFDIVLLGMGDDGHTASLFPQTAALTVGDRLITVGEKQGEPRLTFTVPLINAAHSIIFLVAGANKQEALQKIFHSDADGCAYPSKLINPDHGVLWWLLDAAAGDRLAPDEAIYQTKARPEP
ncbi:6-phosphogluconolactonase [Picosynechococcus sp. PCC 7003]|uniref:6-phosphogluconolactonase n=1 Tax=Picosynechococcus sp. PCC 7003 TaxID=374981 RepID=UPI0008109A68|nr:6-phosphogluconolactonase [Picosynechococcus sp. PCC 7003]ANV83790.1 6-phosphogluconolactonase [Picosynechococcus sp. PCC 7003]